MGWEDSPDLLLMMSINPIIVTIIPTTNPIGKKIRMTTQDEELGNMKLIRSENTAQKRIYKPILATLFSLVTFLVNIILVLYIV